MEQNYTYQTSSHNNQISITKINELSFVHHPPISDSVSDLSSDLSCGKKSLHYKIIYLYFSELTKIFIFSLNFSKKYLEI